MLEAVHPLPIGFGFSFGTMQEVGRRDTTVLWGIPLTICFLKSEAMNTT